MVERILGEMLTDGDALFVIISTVALLVYQVISSYKAMKKKWEREKDDVQSLRK